MNQVLGGGMSCRACSKRYTSSEKSYSVFSYQASFEDAGFVSRSTPGRHRAGACHRDARTSCTPRSTGCNADALTDAELDAAKGHLTGSLAMSLETSASRMRRLGHAEMVEGDVPSLDELVERIEQLVTADDVSRVIDRAVPRQAAAAPSRSSAPTKPPKFSVGLRTTARRRCGRGGRASSSARRHGSRVAARYTPAAPSPRAVSEATASIRRGAGRGRCGSEARPHAGSSSARCPSINAAFAAPATRSEVPNDSIRPPTTSSS